LQFRGGIAVFAIDVKVRAELPGKVAVFGATSNGRNTIAKFVGPLDAEMAEATDALNGDEIARARPAMAESVKRCDTGTKERTGFRWIQAVRNCGESFGRSEHVLLVATIEVDPGDFFILAGDEIAFAARGASEIMAAVPPDSDALAFLPIGDAGAGFVDDARDLMAGNTRVLDAGENAVRWSLKQMPQAWTLIRTCPGPGWGISRSTSSKSPPALETWTAFIFAMESLPLY